MRYFTRRPGFFARKVAIASADKMIWFTDLAAWWTWVAPRDLWNRGPPKAGSKASSRESEEEEEERGRKQINTCTVRPSPIISIFDMLV